MKITRRELVGGALAIPVVAGISTLDWSEPGPTACIFDAQLPAGAELAHAARNAGLGARAVDGDRIRMAREVLAEKPPLLAGITRSADALLFAEVAGEEGYTLALELQGREAGCDAFNCNPDWTPLGRQLVSAQGAWVSAFAGFVADPAAPVDAARTVDGRQATGWLLVRRA